MKINLIIIGICGLLVSGCMTEDLVLVAHSDVVSTCGRAYYQAIPMQMEDEINHVEFQVGPLLSTTAYTNTPSGVTHWLSVLTTDKDTDVQFDGPSMRLHATSIGCFEGELSVYYGSNKTVLIIFTPMADHSL